MVYQPKGSRQHWTGRIEPYAVLVASLVFALANAHSIYWYYSGMNKVDDLQPWVTALFAVAFVLTSFVLSRGLAHRMQYKRPLLVALCIVILFEVVEVSCCFSEAAYSVRYMTWIMNGGFSGFLLNVLSVLPYLILPISPVLAIGLGYFEISAHREKHGQEASPTSVSANTYGPPPVQGVPGRAPVSARPAASPTGSYGPPPVQGVPNRASVPPKPVAPSTGSYGPPPVQGVPHRGSTSVPARPAASPTGSSVQSNETRVLDDALPDYQSSAYMSPEVTTDSLQQDGAMLVTQQPRGGRRFLGIPLGRRQKESEFPDLLV